MANYFVRKTGNDGSAGTSAGAAWLTIGKALGAAGIASGDTVYVKPHENFSQPHETPSGEQLDKPSSG